MHLLAFFPPQALVASVLSLSNKRGGSRFNEALMICLGVVADGKVKEGAGGGRGGTIVSDVTQSRPGAGGVCKLWLEAVSYLVGVGCDTPVLNAFSQLDAEEGW